MGSKHRTELVMELLDKVTKSSILRNSTCSKGHLSLLNGPKSGLEVSIVSLGWLGVRTRFSVNRIRGWRVWVELPRHRQVPNKG